MKFIPTIKMCIKSDVKKLFPCEVINETIYKQIEDSLDEGRIPEFEDISCHCKHGSGNDECHYTGKEIEEMLRFGGVITRCRNYLDPDFNDEGEWR